MDSSTIAELDSLASTVIKLPTKSITPAKSPSGNTAFPSKRKETQQPSYPVSNLPATPAKRITYYCKEHSEEEISYYCFTCWSNICPECAIHGTFPLSQARIRIMR